LQATSSLTNWVNGNPKEFLRQSLELICRVLALSNFHSSVTVQSPVAYVSDNFLMVKLRFIEELKFIIGASRRSVRWFCIERSNCRFHQV
jgi:hypothetical protein